MLRETVQHGGACLQSQIGGLPAQPHGLGQVPSSFKSQFVHGYISVFDMVAVSYIFE